MILILNSPFTFKYDSQKNYNLILVLRRFAVLILIGHSLTQSTQKLRYSEILFRPV